MTKRLEIYRETPPTLPMRAREHMAMCRWCLWSYTETGMPCNRYCKHPLHDPSGGYVPCSTAIRHCRVYRPSVLTRVLQRLRIRPFVERPLER